MTLGTIKTLAEVQALKLPDIGLYTHIVVGQNGACMCGIYDGQMLTCQKIIAMALYGKTDGTVPLPAGKVGPMPLLRMKDLVAVFPPQ